MSRCKIGEVWTSFVNGQYDGEFTIESIGPQGYFTGRHGADTINGQCTGGRIWYFRKRFYYDGAYAGTEALGGSRSGLPLFERGKRISDDDEWLGTHTTLASKTKASVKKKTAKPRR